MEITRIERGWAGHFICSDRCRFRRNTLLSMGNVRIVISTVGLMVAKQAAPDGSYQFETLGGSRYFETLAFHADSEDARYFDADISRQIGINGTSTISEVDADDRANNMHEAIAEEMRLRMLAGEFQPSLPNTPAYL